MQLQFKSWMLALLTLLVVFLIFADISEVEEEIGNSGGRGTIRSAVNSLHSKSNRVEVVINGSSSPAVVDRSNESTKHNIKPAPSTWRHNQTLSLKIRKQILKFLDAEKDISVLKGTLKPGDIIHYIFDRASTMNVSQNLYELLPRTSPLKNKHFRTCAIVGNSGILLNSGCGREIDTHSFVIRNSGGRGTIRSAVNSLHSKSNRVEVVINGSSSPAVVDRSNESTKHNIKPAPSTWRHNQTLSLKIRKQILKFLDAEKDISVLKGTLKPGDIIHYIFDRASTMNVSQNLYELLPRTSPLKNKHFRTCAIVGNSGILLNSGCGREIDTHSFVIRCNLAPVQEYAQDVGVKTDLVTMNPSVIQRAFEDLVNETWREKLLQRLHSLNGSILWIPAFMAKGGKERVEWVNELILKHHVNVRTAYPSLRLLHAVRGYWLTNKVHIKRPTTGLLMYTLATRFCNTIYLYGFWPFPRDQNQNPVKYHYYDSLKYGYTSQASPHTMPLEFKALKTLHQQGALKLTVGECDGAT